MPKEKHYKLRDEAIGFLKKEGYSNIRAEHNLWFEGRVSFADVTGEKDDKLAIIECGNFADFTIRTLKYLNNPKFEEMWHFDYCGNRFYWNRIQLKEMLKDEKLVKKRNVILYDENYEFLKNYKEKEKLPNFSVALNQIIKLVLRPKEEQNGSRN